MARILPRILAASRSCRRAMCTTVAAGSIHLQRPEVLPHSMAGIFSNYCDDNVPYLFARPRGRGPKIDGTFSCGIILDHCNGLILFDDMYVCNPATRRWAILPPPRNETRYGASYLVFDPTRSLDYKVFMIPGLPWNENRGQVEAMDSMEWPPLHHKLQVYSSRTQRWVEETFFREGEPCGTVAEARLDPWEPVDWGPVTRYGEYWKGALYVHCRGTYVMRLSLSQDKFQVIKTPTNIEENKHIEPFLGRSENGIYYATLKDYELRVWILDETGAQRQWVLKHHVNLKTISGVMRTFKNVRGPWAIVDHNSINDEEYEVEDQDVSGWDSDEDDFLDMRAVVDSNSCGKMNFIGFHPYKEIVYLSLRFRVAAYHLGSSKAQYLGCAFPQGYGGHWASFEESFVYTPCLIDSLHSNN